MVKIDLMEIFLKVRSVNVKSMEILADHKVSVFYVYFHEIIKNECLEIIKRIINGIIYKDFDKILN